MADIVRTTSCHGAVDGCMLRCMNGPATAAAVVAALAVGGIVGHEAGMRMEHTAAEHDIDRTLVIDMRDTAFHHDGTTVEAGETVRLVFRNLDAVPHEAVLQVDGGTDEHDHAAHGAGTVSVPPGATAELVHTFGSDPVVVACHLAGHWEAGMGLEIRPRRA